MIPKITIPKKIFGQEIEEDAIEQVLNRTKTQKPIQPLPITRKQGMILVPTAKIYFAPERTHLGEDWNQTQESLKQENLRMPTIEEFRKTLKYFKDSQDPELKKLYNEITEVRNLWRAHWLDAYFEERQGELYILTNNKTKSEKLEFCLMQDKTSGISLDEWLEGKNITSQGIPTSSATTDNKGLYYWYPRNDRVAWFFACSGGAFLVCDGGPGGRDAGLGVFGVADA